MGMNSKYRVGGSISSRHFTVLITIVQPVTAFFWDLLKHEIYLIILYISFSDFAQVLFEESVLNVSLPMPSERFSLFFYT